MSSNYEKFPLWIKIVWLITFLALCASLILVVRCLISEKKGKTIPETNQKIEDLFLVSCVPYYITEILEVRAVITAYNPVPEQTDDTPLITASGKEVREGIIACPVWLPFGSLVEIDGKIYECADRMHPRYWNQPRFDILMYDYQRAREWGKQIKIVRIYK